MWGGNVFCLVRQSAVAIAVQSDSLLAFRLKVSLAETKKTTPFENFMHRAPYVMNWLYNKPIFVHSFMYSDSHIFRDPVAFRHHFCAITGEIQQSQLTLSTSKWFVTVWFIQHFMPHVTFFYVPYTVHHMTVDWSSTSRHAMHTPPHRAILNNTAYLKYFICNFITWQIRTGER